MAIESNFNPNQRTGSNVGLVQFGPQEQREFMSDIPPAQRGTMQAQLIGLQRDTAKNTNILNRTLGRQPTPAELYLMHQQGVAGGPALLTANPNMPAWQAIRRYYRSDAIAQSAIHKNIPSDNPLRRVPTDQITVGQFVSMWRDRFNREMIRRGGQQ